MFLVMETCQRAASSLKLGSAHALLQPPNRLCCAFTSTRQLCRRQTTACHSASKLCRRDALTLALTGAAGLSRPAAGVEQGVKASDFTVPALSAKQYADKIVKLRGQAMQDLNAFAENGRYSELANSLVLSPLDDIRQSVLYIPAALWKEGRRQEAISSRKAYTDFVKQLNRLDEIAQKAARYDADDEDVTDAIQQLSNHLDTVLQCAQSD